MNELLLITCGIRSAESFLHTWFPFSSSSLQQQQQHKHQLHLMQKIAIFYIYTHYIDSLHILHHNTLTATNPFSLVVIIVNFFSIFVIILPKFSVFSGIFYCFDNFLFACSAGGDGVSYFYEYYHNCFTMLKLIWFCISYNTICNKFMFCLILTSIKLWIQKKFWNFPFEYYI